MRCWAAGDDIADQTAAATPGGEQIDAAMRKFRELDPNGVSCIMMLAKSLVHLFECSIELSNQCTDCLHHGCCARLHLNGCTSHKQSAGLFTALPFSWVVGCGKHQQYQLIVW